MDWAGRESEARFAAYVDSLAGVLGHADRAVPLMDYCTGLLLPGERKSVEPMAAIVAPARVAAEHQSLLHFVGQSAWSDGAMLGKARWREGSNEPLSSRFAVVRVRPASRDHKRTEPHPVEWLVVERPEGEAEPTKYSLSTLPEDTPLAVLVDVIKLRWRIERDYEELKSELGLAHFEGRGWRGFHHHASLCIAAYGFLILERSAFPPSARWRREKPAFPGRPRSARAADPSRAPRAQLDRDDAQATDDRPSQIPLSMPMLPSRLTTQELQPALVTQ